MKPSPKIIHSSDLDNSITPKGQCNCACSDSAITNSDPSRFVGLPWSELKSHPELRRMKLDEENQVVYVPPGQGTVNSLAVLNNPAWEILNSFRQTSACEQVIHSWYVGWGESVVNGILRRLIELNFICSPRIAFPPVIDKPSTLEAWFHITDRCNLRCHYCFLPHDSVDMSLETGLGSIDAVFRSALIHQFPKVKFKFAGGEAMLRFPFILKLYEYAKSLGKLHKITVDGVILSNGTLLSKEIIETIKMLGLGLMVSLDGLGNAHDSQRPYAGGYGSSAVVTRAIDFALKLGLIPHISITISNLNVGKLPDLIDWVLKRNLPFSINFYRENEFAMTHHSLRFSEDQIIAGMHAAFKVIEHNLPEFCLLPSLVDLADLSAPHLRPCGAGQNYLVFNHLGQVSKCHMLMKSPITSIKADDPLAFVWADTAGVQNVSVDEKEECNRCEWRYWCSGGCPLVTYGATKRFNKKSPNCSIYKSLYPAVILLEGLRLIRWQGLI